MQKIMTSKRCPDSLAYLRLPEVPRLAGKKVELIIQRPFGKLRHNYSGEGLVAQQVVILGHPRLHRQLRKPPPALKRRPVLLNVFPEMPVLSPQLLRLRPRHRQ